MTLVTQASMSDDAEPSFAYQKPEAVVRNEFTAIIEKEEDWFVAHCLEIPGAHGQANPGKMCLKTWRRRFSCTWRCEGRTACAVCRLRPFLK